MMRSTIVSLILVSVFLSGCSRHGAVMNEVVTSDWKFRKAGDTAWLPATVPGCVHTDLIDNKIIPDPFFRKNEQELKMVEESDWEYSTTLNISNELAAYDHIELQFDGIDTYADIYLNDSLLFRADNMFIGWTAPVKDFIKTGENSLRIYFHSAVRVGLEKLRKVPYTLMAANELAPENERTNVFTRKAPFHYGWDWGPRLVTCGVWKPVKIEAWNTVKIDDLYVKPVKITAEKASYKAMVELVSDVASQVGFEVWVDNKKLDSRTDTTIQQGNTLYGIDFAIEKPELWWTNGLGGQKLYQVEVRMMLGNKIVQTVSLRIGVRTLELVQERDSVGSSFMFRLNGIPVFMKGANYIPSDIFTTRNTLDNYKRVVRDALDANMNMLRVWGGGIYENNELYDLFDEHGILAWNDFMFACNVQPIDSLHLDNIRKEADYNVKRLRNHPSVALWCGNNENLTAWFTWNWKNRYPKGFSDSLWRGYEKIYYEILPGAVNRYHPEVSYWPSSPQSVGNMLADRKSGDEHDWTVWFADAPFSRYAENLPRFVSEYGMQSFPEMKTIRAFANDSDLTYRSAVMEHRQRSNLNWIGPGVNGNEMILRYIKKYYREPKDFSSFVYLSQVMQAEAFRSAIEAHRRNMPWCMGSLYWQINDCWPTMSWASVDYFGRWKASHYFVKNAYEPIVVVPYVSGKNVDVAIVCDKLKDDEGTLILTLHDFAGRELWKKETPVIVKANQSLAGFSMPQAELTNLGNPAKMVLEVILNINGQPVADNLFYFTEGKELELEKPVIKRSVEQKSPTEYEITLHSDKLVKNVGITTEAEGTLSDNYFDMLPGRDYKVLFTGKVELSEDQLIVQCVNESF